MPPPPHLKPPAGAGLFSQQGKAGWGEPPGDSSPRALSWAAVVSRQGGLCRGGPFRGGDQSGVFQRQVKPKLSASKSQEGLYVSIN